MRYPLFILTGLEKDIEVQALRFFGIITENVPVTPEAIFLNICEVAVLTTLLDILVYCRRDRGSKIGCLWTSLMLFHQLVENIYNSLCKPVVVNASLISQNLNTCPF